MGTKNLFQKVGTKTPFKILQFVDTSTTVLTQTSGKKRLDT
jgi:hypothetical protein